MSRLLALAALVFASACASSRTLVISKARVPMQLSNVPARAGELHLDALRGQRGTVVVELHPQTDMTAELSEQSDRVEAVVSFDEESIPASDIDAHYEWAEQMIANIAGTEPVQQLPPVVTAKRGGWRANRGGILLGVQGSLGFSLTGGIVFGYRFPLVSLVVVPQLHWQWVNANSQLFAPPGVFLTEVGVRFHAARIFTLGAGGLVGTYFPDNLLTWGFNIGLYFDVGYKGRHHVGVNAPVTFYDRSPNNRRTVVGLGMSYGFDLW